MSLAFLSFPPLAFAISARFFITVAVQIQSVLLGWQMYTLTHDPLKLGLIGLAEALPALSMALFAGHIVDRTKPVRIYQMLIIIVLCSLFASYLADTEEMLYFASILTGLARAFGGPSMNTIIPKIVEKQDLAKASAWMTMLNRLALVLGPAAAGLLYAWHGYAVAYTIAAILSIVSLGCTFFLPKILPPIQQAHENLFQSLRIAVLYVFKHDILLSILCLDMFAVLFGGVTAILPAIAADILHTDSRGLGFLRASPAAGAILVSFVLTRIPIEKKAGRALLLSILGFGLSILVFASSENIYLSCFVLMLSGAFDSVSMVIRGVIMQMTSPDQMRGRIAAVNSMFIVSSNEIGAFESGVAASVMGLVPSIYFGGIMTLVTAMVIYKINPKIKEINLKEL